MSRKYKVHTHTHTHTHPSAFIKLSHITPPLESILIQNRELSTSCHCFWYYYFDCYCVGFTL